MAFDLEPVDETFFDAAPCRYVYAMDLAAPAHEVWAGLVADRPLSWVRGLRITWTSPAPFGIGTTRTAAGAFGAVRLDESYFRWEDGRRHSFTVMRSNSPMFRRFAEDYLVEPAEGGCTFTWTFAVEPRGPQPVIAAIGSAQRPIFAAMARDTRRHFGVR
jgi:hypothetical protein